MPGQYRTIQGIKYERDLLDLADKEAARGVVTRAVAEQLWEKAMDGGRVTETEARTIRYIMENNAFKLNAAAKRYLDDQLKAPEQKRGRSHTGEEGSPAKQPRTQYDIRIHGISYKRALIEQAKELSAKGDIDYKGALGLWGHANDGTGVTKTEQRTLEKILGEYRFCPDAEEFLKKALQTLPDASALALHGSGGPVAIARDLQASATPVRNGGMLSILSGPISGLLNAASGVLNAALGNNAAASSERATSVPGLLALPGVPGAIASSSVPGSAADGLQALPGVPTRPLIASSSVPGSAADGAGLQSRPGVPTRPLAAAFSVPGSAADGPGLQALPGVPTRPLIASSSVPGSAAYGAGLQSLPRVPTRPLAAAFSVPGSASDGPGSDPLGGLSPELRTLLTEQEPDGGPLAIGNVEQPSQPVTDDTARQRAQVAAEVDRILSTRSAEEILGSTGTTREAMQREYKRIVLLLHADKGIVSSEDQSAALALRLVLAAKKKLLAA